jgi:signal transduction histidine kinase
MIAACLKFQNLYLCRLGKCGSHNPGLYSEMNVRIAGLIFFLIIPFTQVFAQKKQREIDSLKRELARVSTDTTEVNILLELSMKHQNFAPDTAMMYIQSGLEKATKIGYKKGRADALLHIGRLKRDQASSADALKEMFEALEIYREIDDKVQIAHSLNDISIIYATSNDNDNALKYFHQALDIFRQMGDEKGEAYALNNIGIMYQDMDDNAKAKEYYLASLKIKEKHNDQYGISRGYSNLGSISEDENNQEEALDYYQKAEKIFIETKDDRGLTVNYLAIARVKDRQGKKAEARKNALLALKKAQQVKALSQMKRASKMLAQLDEESGNLRSALAYQKQYNTISDSLSNENYQADLEELKAKFNVEEKEREIVLLKKDAELQEARIKQRNILAYSLTSGIVLMVIVVGLLFYVYRATKSKKDSLTQKNIEIAQQNEDLDKLNKEKDRFFSILSHDLRGPLSSLKGLSYLMMHHSNVLTNEELIQVRSKIDQSLDNLTELINNVLEWSMASSQRREKMFDKIDTTDLINKNISFYKTIAESKGVNIIFSPASDVVYGYADYHAIDTVVRNLLSNSIKFSHANKNVTISVAHGANGVHISVKDEGIGIPVEVQHKLFTLDNSTSQPGTANEKGVGLGLTLCKELIRENRGEIKVKSDPGKGSEFIVSIPEYAEA